MYNKIIHINHSKNAKIINKIYVVNFFASSLNRQSNQLQILIIIPTNHLPINLLILSNNEKINLVDSSVTSQQLPETMNVSHEFIIRDYSLTKGIGVGKYISSDSFKVDGREWGVYFFPDGKNIEDNSAYVSVFVCVTSDGPKVNLLFELTLVDQSGKEKHNFPDFGNEWLYDEIHR